MEKDETNGNGKKKDPAAETVKNAKVASLSILPEKNGKWTEKSMKTSWKAEMPFWKSSEAAEILKNHGGKRQCGRYY